MGFWWIFGTIWVPGVLFRGFSPIFWPRVGPKAGRKSRPRTSRVKSRVFFDLKTPKNGQKKYLKCPKQVGMGSQDLPGVGLCPSSCHDVEILLFF